MVHLCSLEFIVFIASKLLTHLDEVYLFLSVLTELWLKANFPAAILC